MGKQLRRPPQEAPPSAAAVADFRAIVEDQTEVIGRLRPDGTYTFVNDVFCRLFGRQREQLLGRKWHPLVHRGDVARVQAAVASLSRRHPVAEVENRVRTARGEWRWMHFVNRGHFDRRGRLVEIQFVGRDITELKAAEHARRESETRFRAVVEDQTELIGRYSPDGTYTFVNDAFCRHFRKRREQLLGRRWQPQVVPEDLPGLLATLRTLSPAHPVVEVENRVRAGDGSVRWMQFVNRGLFDARGRLVETQFVGRDITERKRTEAALRASDARIQDFSRRLLAVREEEKRQFSAALHHDVGSLAVGVLARLAAVEADLQAGRPAGARRALAAAREVFEASLRRLRELAVALRPPDLDLLGLTAALRQHFRAITGGTALRVRFTDATRGARIGAEAQTLLFRAAQECLNNVIRHAGARQVRVRLAVGRRQVSLAVADDGRGFDAARVRAQPGDSMGLRALQEMVAARQGSLMIQSRRGAGTVVQVVLPRTEAHP